METPSAAYDVVTDLKRISWTEMMAAEDKHVSSQEILDGANGGPEAVRARITGLVSAPHYHLAAQFQLLLSGVMQFPNFRMEGVAVHYTDHCVPYGPHHREGDHDFFVLHSRPAGLVYMKDVKRKGLRDQINRKGRELHACERDVKAEPLPNCPGATQKTLISEPSGLYVKIFQFPPGMELKLDAPVYGRYELITQGSAILNGQELAEETLRYVQGTGAAPLLAAGAQGATVIVLNFDQDAAQSYGGSVKEDRVEYYKRLRAEA